MSTLQGTSNPNYSFTGVQTVGTYPTGGPNPTTPVMQVSYTQEQLAIIAVSVQRERELYNQWGFVAGQPASCPCHCHAVTNPDPPAVTQPVPGPTNPSFPFIGPYTGPGGLPQQSPNVLGPFGGQGGLPQGPYVLGPWDGQGGLPQGPYVLGPWDGPGGLPQGPNVLGPFGGQGGLPQGPYVLGPFGGQGGLPAGPNVLGPFGGPGGLPGQSPQLLGPASFGAPNGTFPFFGQFPS